MSLLTFRSQAFSRLLLICGVLVGSAALAQDNSLDAVIRAAETERGRLQSAQVTMTARSVITEAMIKQHEMKNPERDKTEIIQWAFKGEKLFREYETAYDTTQQKNVTHKLTSVKTTDIYDGKDGYSILTEKHSSGGKPHIQGNIEHHRVNHLSPLDFGYKVDTHWLAETLQTNTFRYVDTVQDAAFGTLLHFASEEQKGKRFNVWIAPQFGHLAVRVRHDSAFGGGKQALSMEAKRIEKKGEVWFPVEGSMKSFDTTDGNDNLLTEQTLTVTKWEVNAVPDSKFVPNIPVGAYMKDGETNAFWRVGSNGERIYRDISGGSRQSGFLPGWLSSFVIATLLTLTILAYIRWKRQQSA